MLSNTIQNHNTHIDTERNKEDFMNQRTYRRTASRKTSRFLDSQPVQLLLFYILPFIVVNALIFFLVTARPKYELVVGQTSDYRTTMVTFTIKSHLPLKNVTITLNSEPLDLVKTGNRTYQATISTNGILDVYMQNFNGMSISEYEVVDILDDSAPELVDYNMENDILTLVVKDTQAGIDYQTLHAITAAGEIVEPLSADKATGTISFQMDPGGLTLSIKDLSGNEYQPSFSLVTGTDTDNNPDTTENQVVIE